MTKFFLIITEENRDLIESLLNIIQPIVREIIPIINTLEYDNTLIQPVLVAIVHIGILVGKIGSYCPDVVSLTIPDLIKFGQDALDTLQSNPTVHINPTISPIYYSLYDTFKPLNWQMPASQINFKDILNTSLWLKLTFLSAIKEIYPSLKSILNKNYLNNIVLNTNFTVYPVNARNVSILRTHDLHQKNHVITVAFSDLLDLIYNNPIHDLITDVVQGEGFRLQMQDGETDNILLSYNLPAEAPELLTEINRHSGALLNFDANLLPASHHFLSSIMSLSFTINEENEVRINALIRDIQHEWLLNDPNGYSFVANLRVLRALESAYKVFFPGFVSDVPTLWFENMQ